MTRSVLLISGPPRCGKDTIAKELLTILELEGLSGCTTPIALPLKSMVHAAYASLQGHLPPPGPRQFESTKDHVSDFFCGLTPRQAYIDFHEQFIKPVHGEQFFAFLTANRISKLNYNVAVVTDLGNSGDLRAFRCFEKVVLLRVHRHGCTWNDNRRQAIGIDWGETLDYDNEGSRQDIQLWIRRVLLPALLNQ